MITFQGLCPLSCNSTYGQKELTFSVLRLPVAGELGRGRGASERKVADFIPFHAVSLAEVHDRACVLAPACSHAKCMLLLTRVPQEWEAICANASPFLGKHCKSVFYWQRVSSSAPNVKASEHTRFLDQNDKFRVRCFKITRGHT